MLYLVPSLKFFSEGYRGRVMHALGICEGFANQGWDVTIVGGKDISLFSDELPQSVNFVELKEPEGLFKYISWWFIFLTEFIKLNKQNNYECIITRYVVSSFFPIALFSILSNNQVNKVIEVNSFAYHMTAKFPKFINKLIARIEMLLMNLYDLVYVVSDSMVSDERNKGCSRRIVCIPNGATSKPISFQNFNEENNASRLVYLGTLMPYWNFDYLVEALNKSINELNHNVLFLGDGPMMAFLKGNIASRSNVEFYGRFNRNELGDILDKSRDILLLPPKTKEDMILSGGLSTKLFDYLAMEMPILAPSDGEINNVLSDDVNSKLYNSESVDSFVSSVNDIVSNDQLKEIISKQARNDFENKYSWDARMKVLIEEIYKHEDK